MMSHTSSFKDANRERKKRTIMVGPGDALVPVYYFAKMQQQVISTDENEPSFLLPQGLDMFNFFYLN